MELVNIIKEAVKSVLYNLPLKNSIVFESAPDLSDSTKEVFDELVRRNYNDKFKLVWICSDGIKDSYPKINNVYYVNATNTIKRLWYSYSSKIMICGNRLYFTDNPHQLCFFIPHGSPIKDTSSFYRCPYYCDYMISTSEYMNQKYAQYYKYNINRIIPLGYPRNDILFLPKIDVSKYFGLYDKYIIWYPTVKQYTSGKDIGVKPLAFFDDDSKIRTINEEARKRNILLIIKPHFAQIANMKFKGSSNICIIDNDFYEKNNILPYNFLASCDGLLTDYSSVFYDFMLCNKPIGLVWEDFEEFKEKMGLVDYYEEVTKGCQKIYTLDDLFAFFDDIANDRDTLKRTRRKICKMANCSMIGDNTKRVTDFIEERIKSLL